MKLMKVFEIEKDYQRHKKRLDSIKSLDSKKKVSEKLINSIQKINSFQSKRFCSKFFSDT